MRTEQEFIEELAQIHLKLYHLMLEGEISWTQAAMIDIILDSFDEAWCWYEKHKEDFGE